MRKQRFPFMILPERNAAVGPGETEAKLSRILSSLSLLEASLEEVMERIDPDAPWKRFFTALVPVLDGIGALRAAVEEAGDPEWKRGMEMAAGRLETLLASYGLETSARVGDPFDPARQRAVGTLRSGENPPGSIAEVVEGGWIYKGTVIRHAKVTVAKEET